MDVKSGPSKQFERDVVALMPNLKAFANSLTHDATRSDDLVQETVLKALANHDKFIPDTKLSAWLFTILRNEFYTRFRKTKREVEDVDDRRIALSVADDTSPQPDGGDEFAEVMAQLDALDPETRGILLDVANGESYEFAAKKYGIAVGTVKSRINRARAILVSARNGFDDAAPRPVRTDLTEIVAPKFARELVVPNDFGSPPVLKWLPIESLRIAPRFQREFLRSGQKNVAAIVEAFDWSKFGTAVVADIASGLYSIIDGQHRITAAQICGIKYVPCQIIEADLAKQAESFAAINGNTTALTSLQIHQARIAAGDPDTLRLEKIAAAAECQILRYPVPSGQIGPRQTMAVGTLKSCMKKYGDDVVIAALSCLTKTRGGNPGYLRQQIIAALCVVLSTVPELTTQWAVEKALKIRFDKIWIDSQFVARSQRKQVTPLIVNELKKHFGGDK